MDILPLHSSRSFEAISISVFVVFALLILGEKLRWNYVAAFALVLAAVYLAIAVK